jgi:antimicrobial peptide system SdpA family protein
MAVFTKNPRDSRLQAYSKEGSIWRKITLLESSSGLSIREIFGINRFRRAYGIEVGLILYLIPNKYKKYICKSDIMLCIDKKSVEMIKIKNTSVKPMICGEVLLVEKKVIPWAWVKFKNEEQSMFYWVDVLC